MLPSAQVSVLENDILIRTIMRFLPREHLLNAGLVCKKWYTMSIREFGRRRCDESSMVVFEEDHYLSIDPDMKVSFSEGWIIVKSTIEFHEIIW